jgi:hypothetical protein
MSHPLYLRESNLPDEIPGRYQYVTERPRCNQHEPYLGSDG